MKNLAGGLLAASAMGLNPGAADLSLAASRAKVFLPVDAAVSWRHPASKWRVSARAHERSQAALVAWFDEAVDSVFRKRRLKSTCDSVTGLDCAPIEESRIEDLLWDSRGLLADSLYEYRWRQTLLRAPPPATLQLKNGTLLAFGTPGAMVTLTLARGERPLAVPLDWQFLVRRLSAERLSRLLMAITWPRGTAPPVVAGPAWAREDHWVDTAQQGLHPVKGRRKYAVAVNSEEGHVLRGVSRQTRAHSYWDRQFYTPGELVRGCGSSHVCPASAVPDALHHLLLPRSYSLGERDHAIDGETSIFGKLAGPLPPSLGVVLNAALERTAGSLKQRPLRFPALRRDIVEAAAPLTYLLPPQKTRRWVPPALKPLQSSDTAVLAKLNRDHRTWPYLAAGLQLEPELVRRWLRGEEMREADLVVAGSGESAAKNAKRTLAFIPYAVNLPQLLARAFTLSLLHVARIYVALLSRWYSSDGEDAPPAIRQYRDQVDLAISANAFRGRDNATVKRSSPKDSATASPPGPLSEKRMELLALYDRLIATEVSPIKSSSWQRVDFEWPADEAANRLSEHRTALAGIPAGHTIQLKGAWSEPGILTSLAGELHVKPASVVTGVTLVFGGSTTSETPALDVIGFEYANSTAEALQLERCLRRFRRGLACEELQTVWRYRVVPPEQASAQIKLDETQLIAGTKFRRVDLIAFAWERNHTLPPGDGAIQPADDAPVPQWAENSASATVQLAHLTLHLPKRTYEIRPEVLDELVSLNLAAETAPLGPKNLNRRTRELKKQILELAALREDLFETAPREHAVALVVQPRKVSPPFDFDAIGLAHPPEELDVGPTPPALVEESEWIPRSRLDHFVKYWGTLPANIRFNVRSIGLDRGGVVPRGFQLPLAAQTATDASLVRSAHRALSEFRGRPFLTIEGSVVDSDLRTPDTFEADVHVIRDLPVEAPLVNLQLMKEQRKISRFLFNEFARGRLSDETRTLDERSKEKLLKYLRARLEVKMADLAENQANSQQTVIPDVPSQPRPTTLEPGPNNKHYEALGIRPQDEEPPLSNEEIDTTAARTLAADRASSPSVIDALRRVAVDHDLNEIVADTLGEVEASVMDLIKDVTIIAVTEDPETGETISRKVQLEVNGGRLSPVDAADDADHAEEPRSIAFEIATIDADGQEHWVELLVPIHIMQDAAAVTAHIREKFGFDEAEAQRLAEEIAKLVDGYDLDEFDALLDVLDDYNLSDDDYAY